MDYNESKNTSFMVEDTPKRCPECGGQIVLHSHEVVCESCGLVFSSQQFVSSYQFQENESLEFRRSDQMVSLGSTVDNVSLLGSHIGFYQSRFFYDYKNRALSASVQQKFFRLKRIYSLPLKLKNHETDYRVLTILNKISNYLSIPKPVKMRSAYFYRKIKKNAKSIRNHISLIGFCLFYASREFGSSSPLSLREICDAFRLMGHRVSPKLILRDGLEYQSIIKRKNIPHSSEDYIIKFIDRIVNSPITQERMSMKNISLSSVEYRLALLRWCRYVLKKTKNLVSNGRNPYIFASAAVYCADRFVAREYNIKPILTQESASKAMGVTQYSLRDHYTKLLKPFFGL